MSKAWDDATIPAAPAEVMLATDSFANAGTPPFSILISHREFGMDDLGSILNWGQDDHDTVQHTEIFGDPLSGRSYHLVFSRNVHTMHPDEFIFLKTFRILCAMGELPEEKFLSCNRLISLSSDATVWFEGHEVDYRSAHGYAAYQTIKDITSYDRGKVYAGYKEAILAMAEHVSDGPLKDFLTRMSTALQS